MIIILYSIQLRGNLSPLLTSEYLKADWYRLENLWSPQYSRDPNDQYSRDSNEVHRKNNFFYEFLASSDEIGLFIDQVKTGSGIVSCFEDCSRWMIWLLAILIEARLISDGREDCDLIWSFVLLNEFIASIRDNMSCVRLRGPFLN